MMTPAPFGPTELRAAATELYADEWGWQTRLAKALQVDSSTVRRWLYGSVPIPGPAAAAIRCFVERKRDRDQRDGAGAHDSVT